MKEIKLTQGKVALVDDDDFTYLNQWRWYSKKGHNTYYAARTNHSENRSILMHRVIMGVTNPQIAIDHKDRNGLNNQRQNIRICTPSGNQSNRTKSKNKISKYLGVNWLRKTNRWIAQARSNGKLIYIGIFIDEVDAAIAYNQVAKKVHGEFANLNIIPEAREPVVEPKKTGNRPLVYNKKPRILF